MSLGFAVALVLLGSLARAEVLPYRVAGILDVGDERYRAVIELSADEQGIFQEGDALGNGTILEVNPDGVRVAVGDEQYFLALRGDGSAVYHEYKDPAAPVTGTIEANYAQVLERLSAVLADDRKQDPDAMRQAVNRILRLPGQARITAIDREAVESQRSMVETLKSALANQAPPQLLISGVPGMEEVYVLPSGAGEDNQ